MSPLRPKVGEILSPLTIETLVNGGAGLARYRGQVVFIPDTAVGDTLSCRVTKSKKTFLEAEVVEIFNPASIRRTTKCLVSGDCGGCHWQHLPYPEQLHWKESLFHETLSRRCHCGAEHLLPIITAADEWNYRSRVQIKCGVRDSVFMTGFYRRKSHDIVSIEDCPVIAPELNNLLNLLRESVSSTQFAAHISQFDLAVGADGYCSVVIHYSGDNADALAGFLQAEKLSADLQIKSRRSSELVTVQGDGVLTIAVDSPPIHLRYAAGSFAQINLQQNGVLVDTVTGLADLSGEEQVLDLYCGMGNFSLPLARRAQSVVGVEESAVSIEMAHINSRLNKIDNIEFHNDSAEGALSLYRQQRPVDVLVLDPPRSGAAVVMGELLKAPVKKVIYISCDPQTLARDLSLLVNGGYELISSQPIDLFPQTYHCESVTLLEYRD